MTLANTTAPAAFAKYIGYDRVSKDYCATLDGQVIGFFATHHDAEIALDQMVFEMLTHGDCATAEELDGGQCSGFGCVDGCADCDPPAEPSPLGDEEGDTLPVGDDWEFTAADEAEPDDDSDLVEAMADDDYADAMAEMAMGSYNGKVPSDFAAPITIGQRFEHLGFGKGAVINITDDERLNVQVKFDNPSRYGSKFWFDMSEVVRCPTCGGEGDCPDCDPPVDIPDEYPDPTPSGPEPGEWAVSAQSIQIEQTMQRNRICTNCGEAHYTWRCPEIAARLFAPESWSDPDLGRELCRMRWLRFAEFQKLLASVPHQTLLAYAASYQAFIRSYRPDSDLTISQVLAAWAKVGDRGPAAQQVAA